MVDQVERMRDRAGRAADRPTLIIYAWCALIAVGLFFGGFTLWWYYVESQGTRIDLELTNHASRDAEAAIVEDSRAAAGDAAATASVGPVDPGDRAGSSWLLGRMAGASVMRVTVGRDVYEGKAGVMLDDDGPHRFWIDVYDGPVEVTRQSNESPWQLEMQVVE